MAGVARREREEAGCRVPALILDRDFPLAGEHVFALVVSGVGMNIERTTWRRSGFRFEREVHLAGRRNSRQNAQRAKNTVIRLHEMKCAISRVNHQLRTPCDVFGMDSAAAAPAIRI